MGDELLLLFLGIFLLLAFLLLDVNSARTLTVCEGVDVELYGDFGTLGELKILLLFLLIFALVFVFLIFLFIIVLILIFTLIRRLIVGIVYIGVNVFILGLECIIINPNYGCISLTKVVTFGWHPCCLLG